jgi:hypothetical protein
MSRLDIVANGEMWTVEGEVNPRKSEPTTAKVGSPKRGDHVFALGFSGTLADMRVQASAGVQNVDMRRAPGVRILMEALEGSVVLARGIPELVVRKEGVREGSGDAHSKIYGQRSRAALLAVVSLAHGLGRYYDDREERVSAETATRSVATASAEAAISVGAWLDWVVDNESVPLVPKSELASLAMGRQRIEAIRAELVAAIRRVAGR